MFFFIISQKAFKDKLIKTFKEGKTTLVILRSLPHIECFNKYSVFLEYYKQLFFLNNHGLDFSRAKKNQKLWEIDALNILRIRSFAITEDDNLQERILNYNALVRH